MVPVRDTDYAIADELEKFRKDGSMLRGKARMVYEELEIPRLVTIVQDVDTSGTMILAVADHLANIGDMKPKQNMPALPGSGFSITINIPSGPGPAPMASIDGEVISSTPLPEPELPPKPEGFRIPDFRLSPDLSGGAAIPQTLTPSQASQAPVPQKVTA